ncbi:hypothetical protein L6164_005024 [Bauhinia variegata]|uniref:Uncharacterized protein n=1 Tax=Bauhinia variegata TaxID=167791 RepID=A0ACB9PPF8_BAUVA|nr:hypothetical protein L6164_005024 [Bauhinia variegata]
MSAKGRGPPILDDSNKYKSLCLCMRNKGRAGIKEKWLLGIQFHILSICSEAALRQVWLWRDDSCSSNCFLGSWTCVLLTQIAIFERGTQKLSKYAVGIVSVLRLFAAICLFTALHSSLGFG